MATLPPHATSDRTYKARAAWTRAHRNGCEPTAELRAEVLVSTMIDLLAYRTAGLPDALRKKVLAEIATAL